MNYIFHPDADLELFDAIDYYEANELGLGEDFYLEVMATVARIARFPKAWPVLDGDVRRCLTHRYPYGVLYSVDSDAVFILAVMHLHRDPDYWKHRNRDH